MKNILLLNAVWNCVDEEHTHSSKEERMALDVVIKKEDALTSTLTKKQIELFREYQDAFSELELITQKEKFVKGIKFATKYILEATNSD